MMRLRIDEAVCNTNAHAGTRELRTMQSSRRDAQGHIATASGSAGRTRPRIHGCSSYGSEGHDDGHETTNARPGKAHPSQSQYYAKASMLYLALDSGVCPQAQLALAKHRTASRIPGSADWSGSTLGSIWRTISHQESRDICPPGPPGRGKVGYEDQSMAVGEAGAEAHGQSSPAHLVTLDLCFYLLRSKALQPRFGSNEIVREPRAPDTADHKVLPWPCRHSARARREHQGRGAEQPPAQMPETQTLRRRADSSTGERRRTCEERHLLDRPRVDDPQEAHGGARQRRHEPHNGRAQELPSPSGKSTQTHAQTNVPPASFTDEK